MGGLKGSAVLQLYATKCEEVVNYNYMWLGIYIVKIALHIYDDIEQ